jgi:hypothetical protein
MSRSARSHTTAAILTLLVASIAACGADEGQQASHPPGSPENPKIAAPIDAATAADAKKKGHFNEAQAEANAAPSAGQKPCTLVSADEAARILGKSVLKPSEAPQGPTCVYRSRSGNDFVTLAVSRMDGAMLKSQTSKLEKVGVAGRTGYCIPAGQSMLYVPLPNGQLLTIGGPCAVARAFAVKAIPQLDS